MAFDLGELLKDVSTVGTGREQIEYIRLDLIEEDPNNFYHLSGIEDLAANIELCGLQQPIRVRAIPDSCRYRIVSGHRRRKAVELLAQDNPQRWNEIPCIIEADEASPALQQLRLIYANANTRTMTSAEVSEQAVQVEKLLYKLKEDGYEFPGRMRDHVAQAVGASKSKLARLKVIRDGISACWRPKWEDGTLGESSAYELAKMPKALQNLLYEEKVRTNANIKWLYADDIKRFAERCDKIGKLTCDIRSDDDGGCANYEAKVRKAAVADRYGGFICDHTCCMDCPELKRCKAACSKCQAHKQALIASAKAVAKAEKLAQEEKDAPKVRAISELWQRFGLARGLADKTIDDCKKALGLYQFPFDYEKTMALECGEAKLTAETKLPYGYNCSLEDVQKLVNIADMFGCSLDWLFCRTDVRETANAVPTVGTTWRTGNPEAYGTYVAYVEIAGSDKKTLRELLWDGEEWYLFGNPIDENVMVCRWTDRPEA